MEELSNLLVFTLPTLRRARELLIINNLLEVIMATKVILSCIIWFPPTLNLCLQLGEFEISKKANIYFYFNEGRLMQPDTKS